MAAKYLIVLCVVVHSCLGGIVPAVPAVAAYSVPYASSYSSSVVNHAIAAPVVHPYVAAHPAAPLLAAPGIHPYAAYSAFPYPYAAAPAPLITG